MANSNDTTTPSAKGASFADANGITISIPADQLPLYSLIKSEQMSALSSLINDHVAGNKIEISDSDIGIFTSLANELSFAANRSVLAITESALFGNASQKGGA